MLSIGKIALGQHRYYEQQVAQGRDDYYSGRGEAPGEWAGTGSEALGLSGRVRAQQFTTLLAGYDPRGAAVRLRSSDRDPKVVALDLTFSAPKSISVLAAVAPEEITAELILAHEQALRAALVYLEDTAVHVRRGHDGHEVQRGEGLIAAAYRHRMSRALDPQLHTHVVAANLTRGPDGRYTALHGAPLYRAAKTAGFLYQAHLRALVTQRLRLQWGPVHKGAAELYDMPPAVLEGFSKRRRQMLREARNGGIGLNTKAAAETAGVYWRAGYRVLGTAPTARGARQLEEHGIAARTLDRLLIDLDRDGRLPERCVVIFDEAGADAIKRATAGGSRAGSGERHCDRRFRPAGLRAGRGMACLPRPRARVAAPDRGHATARPGRAPRAGRAARSPAVALPRLGEIPRPDSDLR